MAYLSPRYQNNYYALSSPNSIVPTNNFSNETARMTPPLSSLYTKVESPKILYETNKSLSNFISNISNKNIKSTYLSNNNNLNNEDDNEEEGENIRQAILSKNCSSNKGIKHSEFYKRTQSPYNNRFNSGLNNLTAIGNGSNSKNNNDYFNDSSNFIPNLNINNRIINNIPQVSNNIYGTNCNENDYNIPNSSRDYYNNLYKGLNNEYNVMYNNQKDSSTKITNSLNDINSLNKINSIQNNLNNGNKLNSDSKGYQNKAIYNNINKINNSNNTNNTNKINKNIDFSNYGMNNNQNSFKNSNLEIKDYNKYSKKDENEYINTFTINNKNLNFLNTEINNLIDDDQDIETNFNNQKENIDSNNLNSNSKRGSRNKKPNINELNNKNKYKGSKTSNELSLDINHNINNNFINTASDKDINDLLNLNNNNINNINTAKPKLIKNKPKVTNKSKSKGKKIKNNSVTNTEVIQKMNENVNNPPIIQQVNYTFIPDKLQVQNQEPLSFAIIAKKPKNKPKPKPKKPKKIPLIISNSDNNDIETCFTIEGIIKPPVFTNVIIDKTKINNYIPSSYQSSFNKLSQTVNNNLSFLSVKKDVKILSIRKNISLTLKSTTDNVKKIKNLESRLSEMKFSLNEMDNIKKINDSVTKERKKMKADFDNLSKEKNKYFKESNNSKQLMKKMEGRLILSERELKTTKKKLVELTNLYNVNNKKIEEYIKEIELLKKQNENINKKNMGKENVAKENELLKDKIRSLQVSIDKRDNTINELIGKLNNEEDDDNNKEIRDEEKEDIVNMEHMDDIDNVKYLDKDKKINDIPMDDLNKSDNQKHMSIELIDSKDFVGNNNEINKSHDGINKNINVDGDSANNSKDDNDDDNDNDNDKDNEKVIIQDNIKEMEEEDENENENDEIGD